MNDQRRTTNKKENQSNNLNETNVYLCVIVQKFSNREDDIWSTT